MQVQGFPAWFLHSLLISSLQIAPLPAFRRDPKTQQNGASASMSRNTHKPFICFAQVTTGLVS